METVHDQPLGPRLCVNMCLMSLAFLVPVTMDVPALFLLRWDVMDSQ